MTAMTFFYQGCPVCGRNLRVPVKYFGRLMSCTHCHGEFLAGKDELPACPPAPAPLNRATTTAPDAPATAALAR